MIFNSGKINSHIASRSRVDESNKLPISGIKLRSGKQIPYYTKAQLKSRIALKKKVIKMEPVKPVDNISYYRVFFVILVIQALVVASCLYFTPNFVLNDFVSKNYPCYDIIIPLIKIGIKNCSDVASIAAENAKMQLMGIHIDILDSYNYTRF